MASSPGANAVYCNSCGTANLPGSLSCVQCSRSFPESNLATSASSSDLSGFGGWLIFFCFGTCIGTPIWFAKEYLHPHLFFNWLAVLSAIPTLLGLVGGMMLAFENPQALVLLRLFFVSLLVKSAAWLSLLLIRSGNHQTYLMISLRTLLYVVIWSLYFLKSVRVRNTYGRNL